MYELFEQLLQKRGITPYRVHKDTGIAQSTLSDWKTRGRTPSVENMIVLSEYFGVSIDYLLGKEQQKDNGEAKTGNASEEDIKFALFDGDKEITDEMYEEVKAFAAFVKQRELKKRDEKSS